MRSWLRPTVVPSAIVLGLILVAAPVSSNVTDKAASRWVDFRMAPMEQAKKINLQMRTRKGTGQTSTIMHLRGAGEGQHLILDAANATPHAVSKQLSSGVDSVSWYRIGDLPLGSCDSQAECEQKTDELCDDSGHSGVDVTTVTITIHADGSKTCSGDCNDGGAVAFVTCNP